MNAVTGCHKGFEVLSRHVLVVEGDDVDRFSKRAQRVEVLVVPDGHLRGNLRGRRPFCLRQNMKSNTERFGSGRHHARQLTAADYTNTWKRHALTLAPATRPSPE